MIIIFPIDFMIYWLIFAIDLQIFGMLSQFYDKE